MKRSTVRVPVLAIVACLVIGGVAVAQGAAVPPDVKPALAIAHVGVSPGWTLPPPQLAGAIIDLLVNELVAGDRFRVYDGQWLVPEAELGGRVNLDRLREAAADRRVDYVVLGNLIGLSTESKSRRGGGLLPKPIALGGFSRDQTQVEVRVVFRVIDVRTGEIVTSAEGLGLGVRKATSVGVGGLLHGLPLVGAHVSNRMPASRDAMLNEAMKMAVHQAAQALGASATRLGRP